MDSEGEIHSNTVRAVDFNILLALMKRSSRQKINKEMEVFNDTVVQMDCINIFCSFCPKATEYTFFSSAHGTFSRMDLIKLKKIEIISSIFSDHNSIKLEISYKKKLKNTQAHTGKITFF